MYKFTKDDLMQAYDQLEKFWKEGGIHRYGGYLELKLIVSTIQYIKQQMKVQRRAQ